MQRQRGLYKLPWGGVSIFNKKVLASRLYAEALQAYVYSEEDLLVVRDILDKQIVDAEGVKVVRVNDIKLEGFRGDALLVAVDVGMRGILRRLGIERAGEDFLRLFRAELPLRLISWNYIQPLHSKLGAIGLTVPRKMLAELHPADLAELLSQVSHDEGAAFIHSLDVETAAETISEMGHQAQAAIIKEMDPQRASDILEEMAPDAAADLLAGLSSEKAKEILEKMGHQEAQDIQELLSHEKDTAGGLMTTEYVAYPPGMTVQEVLERFRQDAKDIETVYYIYVVDAQQLVGVLSLRELLLAPPGAKLSELMETNLKTVSPEEDELKVAQMLAKYNLVALPVVDEAGRLMGIVTVDDVMDLLLPQRRKRRAI